MVDKDQKQVNFRFPVHATSEFGDGPLYTDVSINKKSLAQMDKDVANLKEIGFDVGKKSLPMMAIWEDEKEYRLRDETLSVTDDSFVWASARPKHADYDVETMPMNLELIKKLHGAALEVGADTVDLHDEGPRDVPSVSLKKDGETMAQEEMEFIVTRNGIQLDGLIEQASQNDEPSGPQPR